VSEKKHIVYIGLGSNLGDRELNISSAINNISNHPLNKLILSSKNYSNPAIDTAGPEEFLNSVIKIETNLEARELLKYLQELESELDPERNQRGRKTARYIDIDILKYDDLNIDEPGLVIPHPRMFERDFVMKPLREIEALEYSNEIVQKYSSDLNDIHVPELFYGEENPIKLKVVSEFVKQKLNSSELINIRKLYLSDIDAIHEIDRLCYGDQHWSRAIFVRELENPNAIYYVAETKNPKLIKQKLLAFIGVWLILDEMHIMTIATHPEYQGRKIAEQLLIAALDTALVNGVRTVTLEVRLSNTAAQKLYEKYDFKHQGIRKNYYNDDGESALILWTENIQEEKFLDLLKHRVKELKN
jgi:[ribosomal protein S18]-alanine N-acetyltransferase